MNSKLQSFGAIVLIATLGLVACGQKKETNSGKSTRGGSSTTTTGTGNAATNGAAAKSVELRITNSTLGRGYIGGGEIGSEVHFSITFNGQIRSLSTVHPSDMDSVNPRPMIDTQTFNQSPYTVKYSAYCNNFDCDQYVVTFWITSGGLTQVQYGFIKNGADELSGTVIQGSENMIDLNAMIDLLHP